MKIKTFYVMEYFEFEELVQDALKQKYSFMNDMDVGNDSDSTFMDIGNDIYYDYEKEDLRRFVGCGEGKFLARTLLKHLVAIEKLNPGNYLIQVYY